MFPSYRNYSVDLQSKLTDWFLYDEKIGREKVKGSKIKFQIIFAEIFRLPG